MLCSLNNKYYCLPSILLKVSNYQDIALLNNAFLLLWTGACYRQKIAQCRSQITSASGARVPPKVKVTSN